MLIAPHPDDEALAASILLHRASRAGSAVRIVYLTDGDNNPWPQRFVERKWRLDTTDRQRWGRLRRGEAVAALEALGLLAEDATFLGLPDQGLTSLLLDTTFQTAARISKLVREWQPTEILFPSSCDKHPDHNAAAVLARLALANCPEDLPEIRAWTYLVHGQNDAFYRSAGYLSQTESERACKIRAIRCHRSQVMLSGRRFLRYATRPEYFALVTKNTATGEGALRLAFRKMSTLCLNFDLQAIRSSGAREGTILMVGQDLRGAARSLRVAIPARSRKVAVEDWKTGESISTAFFQRDGLSGTLSMPTELFSDKESVFMKCHRRSLFFDREGWLELPPRPTRSVLGGGIDSMDTECFVATA
jgi:LmbE family N-acetylglucosaminyl deacetylase